MSDVQEFDSPEAELAHIRRNTAIGGAVITGTFALCGLASGNPLFGMAASIQGGNHAEAVLRMDSVDTYNGFAGEGARKNAAAIGAGMAVGSAAFLTEAVKASGPVRKGLCLLAAAATASLAVLACTAPKADHKIGGRA